MEDEKDRPSQNDMGEIMLQLAGLAAQLRELAERPLFDQPGNDDVPDDHQAETAAAAGPLP
jgi:hypothetical protein